MDGRHVTVFTPRSGVSSPDHHPSNGHKPATSPTLRTTQDLPSPRPAPRTLTAMEVFMSSPHWQPDILGDGYRQHVLDLGADPDGEGRIVAVLVRRDIQPGETVHGAVLYVHGFSDYFFQTPLADFLAAHGLVFYALDLRKSAAHAAKGTPPTTCPTLRSTTPSSTVPSASSAPPTPACPSSCSPTPPAADHLTVAGPPPRCRTRAPSSRPRPQQPLV